VVLHQRIHGELLAQVRRASLKVQRLQQGERTAQRQELLAGGKATLDLRKPRHRWVKWRRKRVALLAQKQKRVGKRFCVRVRL